MVNARGAVLLVLFVAARAATHADLPIIERTQVSLEALRLHVESRNPGVDPVYLRSLYGHYVRECAAEGVSLVVALAQMVHETDHLRFGGDVRPIQYNYAGLGATGGGAVGDRFPDMQIGVRAHVQHLKAYADTEPLAGPLVDLRFRFVVRGSAATVMALTGRWATDPLYGEKLLAHAGRLAALSAFVPQGQRP